MENDAVIQIELVYAGPQAPAGLWRQILSLPAGSTVAQAIAASSLSQAFPGIDPYAHGVGVYGKLCDATRVLTSGDRVEIYQPLKFDPKESRRRRVAHRRAKAALEGRARPPGLL